MKALHTGSLVALAFLLTHFGSLPGHALTEGDTPEEAVNRLGDSSFEIRTEAEKRLRELGQAAVPALEKGLLNSDLEIRKQCSLLLPDLKRSEEKIELDAFIQNLRDPKKPPLPGWDKLKTYVGEDMSGRLVYADFFLHDKATLELLAKKPADLAAQFPSRLQKFQQKANTQVANKDMEAAKAEFRSLVLAGLCSKVDQNQFNQMSNAFYGNIARAAAANDAGTRRLLSRLFSERMKDLNQAQQYIYIANYLQLTELIESQIRPVIEKHVDEAVKSKDPNRLVQVVYMVNNMQSTALVEGKLKPAVLKIVEDSIRGVEDYSKLQQAVNLCQVLGMQDVLEDRLKPVVARYILKSAENLKDMSRIYQSRYLAQMVGLNEMLDAIMRPAVIKMVAESAENAGDLAAVQNAFYLANNLNMQELNEGLLKPAARAAILASLEKPGDWSGLSQTVNICQQLGLQDLLEQSVKPVFSKNAPAMIAAAAKDPNQLQQIYYLANNLGATVVIEDQIKPAIRKYFQTAVLNKTNINNTYQMMYLAKNLQLKEAVPLALKTAAAKEAQGYVRGLAIQFVGEFGTKEQIPLLEPFLTDKGEVGQMGINFTTVKAEVRDVALAVLLTHKGENLANYGYPYFQIANGITLYQTSAQCAGFSDNTGRDAAFKKYNDLMAKQKTKS